MSRGISEGFTSEYHTKAASSDEILLLKNRPALSERRLSPRRRCAYEVGWVQLRATLAGSTFGWEFCQRRGHSGGKASKTS